MVLTWGLLGPGKGIEHAIDSMALLRERGLHVDYQVAGQTHPRVLGRDGEAYRRGRSWPGRGRGRWKIACTSTAGSCPRLPWGQLISAADVVLPYDWLEQVTSGVLIEAVTAGKPVVSTCFPHAVELLGAGLLVDRQDPAGIARALQRALTEPGLSGQDEGRLTSADASGGDAGTRGGGALIPGTGIAAHRRQGGRPGMRRPRPCRSGTCSA